MVQYFGARHFVAPVTWRGRAIVSPMSVRGAMPVLKDSGRWEWGGVGDSDNKDGAEFKIV